MPTNLKSPPPSSILMPNRIWLAVLVAGAIFLGWSYFDRKPVDPIPTQPTPNAIAPERTPKP